jgi:DnaJ-class molecular chaperone
MVFLACRRLFVYIIGRKTQQTCHGRGDVMENTAQTCNSIKAGSSPRSVIIATASKKTKDDDAISERILAEEFANARHSCFDDDIPDTDLYAEFMHSYF